MSDHLMTFCGHAIEIPPPMSLVINMTMLDEIERKANGLKEIVLNVDGSWCGCEREAGLAGQVNGRKGGGLMSVLSAQVDELRRMLDERGVEYEGGNCSVRWRDRNGVMMQAFPLADGELGMDVWSCTPEQAIAATLGRGTCRNVAEPDEYSDRPFTCSECGARGPMGNGTYHLASSWAMEDGTLAFADSWLVWKYCPNCGAKVVYPTTNDVDVEVEQ